MTDSLTIWGTDYTGVKGFKATDANDQTKAYIRPQGTKSITQNGTSIDVSEYAAVDVNVSGGINIPTFTVTLASDGETVVSLTCDKTFAECNALSDIGECAAYLVLNITDGVTYTDGLVSTFYDHDNEIIYSYKWYFDISYTPSSLTASMPSWFTETLSVTENGTYYPAGGVITEVNVNVSGGGSPTLQTKTKNYTPTESEQTEAVSADSGYDGLDTVNVTVGAISSSYVGSGITRRSSSDLSASGATVSVPAGYYESSASTSVASGTEGTPTATKGTVSNHSVSVTPSVTNSAGYIQGGTKTGTAVTVTASALASGNKAISSNGTDIDVVGYSTVSVAVPTGTARDSSDLSVSGATVNVPAGLYSSAASASVASGTAGTPTATKGSVSNHSVTVTPSVTNTAGYISGGTKTGTGVSVSASELVSGSETKNANGTYDVTNLASLVVAVPIVTYYTGSSAPSSSLGSNGDIYLQTS